MARDDIVSHANHASLLRYCLACSSEWADESVADGYLQAFGLTCSHQREHRSAVSGFHPSTGAKS